MKILFLILLIYPIQLFSQENKPEIKRNFIAIFPKKNKKITANGIGIGPILAASPKSKINGLALEIPGIGIIGQFGKGPVDSISINYIKVNGISISALGTFSNTNGISINGFGSSGYQNNGLFFSLGFAFFAKGNGIIISGFNHCKDLKGLQIGFLNSTQKARGLQIGVTNYSNDLKGIQIGIWNVNNKRK